MPNRILRDTALDSDRIASVDEGAEVLFYRLIMLADDFGRFDGRLAVIRARAFALRQQITEKEIERRLSQLVKSNLIIRYTVENKPYIEIPRFGQRQRAEKSKFPPNCQSNDGHMSVNGQTSAPVVVVVDVVEDGGETTTAPDATHPTPKQNGKIAFDFEKGVFIGITEDQELVWQDAYPAVPIPPAIAQAGAWLKANPANRKSNYERFLVNWFKREQDRAGRVKR